MAKEPARRFQTPARWPRASAFFKAKSTPGVTPSVPRTRDTGTLLEAPTSFGVRDRTLLEAPPDLAIRHRTVVEGPADRRRPTMFEHGLAGISGDAEPASTAARAQPGWLWPAIAARVGLVGIVIGTVIPDVRSLPRPRHVRWPRTGPPRTSPRAVVQAPEGTACSPGPHGAGAGAGAGGSAGRNRPVGSPGGRSCRPRKAQAELDGPGRRGTPRPVPAPAYASVPGRPPEMSPVRGPPPGASRWRRRTASPGRGGALPGPRRRGTRGADRRSSTRGNGRTPNTPRSSASSRTRPTTSPSTRSPSAPRSTGPR